MIFRIRFCKRGKFYRDDGNTEPQWGPWQLFHAYTWADVDERGRTWGQLAAHWTLDKLVKRSPSETALIDAALAGRLGALRRCWLAWDPVSSGSL